LISPSKISGVSDCQIYSLSSENFNGSRVSMTDDNATPRWPVDTFIQPLEGAIASSGSTDGNTGTTDEDQSGNEENSDENDSSKPSDRLPGDRATGDLLDGENTPVASMAFLPAILLVAVSLLRRRTVH
jgi:hypothetical protein